MDAWQIIALLGFVIMVYAWIMMKKQDQPDHSAILSEVDHTLEAYVTEITASNRRVTDQLAQMNRTHAEEKQQWQERLLQLEQQVTDLRQRIEQAGGSGAGSASPGVPGIVDRYSKLIEMKQRGLTTQQIVKETGMNHGEVKFILQLAAQEAHKLEE